KPLWVDLAASNTPTLLYASLAQQAGVRMPPSIAAKGDWQAFWGDFLLPSLDFGYQTIVLNGVHEILDQSFRPPLWLSPILDHCVPVKQGNSLPLIMISSRAMDLPAKVQSVSMEMHVGRLADEDIIRSLRARLARGIPRREITQDQLNRAAVLLKGYA